jgi:hypothetical protein
VIARIFVLAPVHRWRWTVELDGGARPVSDAGERVTEGPGPGEPATRALPAGGFTPIR